MNVVSLVGARHEANAGFIVVLKHSPGDHASVVCRCNLHKNIHTWPSIQNAGTSEATENRRLVCNQEPSPGYYLLSKLQRVIMTFVSTLGLVLRNI